MRILQLCLRVPDPPGDGGAIAMKAIASSLMQAGATVKVLAFNTRKHFVDPSKISTAYKNETQLETIFLDASVRIIPAFLNLFSGSSYNIERFKSKEFEEKLVHIIQEQPYDIIQLESLFLAPYVDVIRKFSKAKIVLRAHNIEYLIWSRLAASCRNYIKKRYLSMLASRLRSYEINMLNQYDMILPITHEDEKMLRQDGCRIPVHVTPLGLDTNKYHFVENTLDPFSIFHLGSMDWQPNIEAVDWFLDHVMPGLLVKDPGMLIYLAGKKMPDRIKHLMTKNLVIEDVISDAIKYMAHKTVMVVPLLSGSGMRVKIIEGMAMGKTIISTTIGAEGIACEHLKNIIIADTPQEFIKWVLACKTDPGFTAKIGREAAVLAASRYDNKIIGKELIQFYDRELSGSIKFVP